MNASDGKLGGAREQGYHLYTLWKTNDCLTSPPPLPLPPHTLTHTHTHTGRYSDQYILDFYKQKLKSMPCQNQGFILDGFPKTYEQAKQLFARMLYFLFRNNKTELTHAFT